MTGKKVPHPYFVAFLVFLMTTFGFLGTQLYLPSLPSMARAFELPNSTIQLTMTVYYFSFAFFQLFYGPLSDKYGRKPVLVLGLGMSLVGTLGCAVADSIEFLMVCRVLQGAGLGASNALARTILRDTFDDTKLAKMWSFVMTAISLAPAVAPTLGGYIQQTYGWRMVFFFALTYLSIGAVLILAMLPETNDHKNKDAFHPILLLKNYWNVMHRKTFMGNMLCSAMGMGGITAYGVATPFIYQNIIGLTPFENGQLAFFTALSAMAGSFVSGLLVEKIGSMRMIKFSLFLMLISGLGVIFTGLLEIYTTLSVLIPSLLFFVGAGIIFPNTAAGAFKGLEKKAGAGSAVFGCIRVMMSFVTTTLVAYLPETSQIYFGSLFAVLGVAGILLYYLLLHEKESIA